MQRLNVLVSDSVFKLVQSVPKANRGQLINTAVEYFMNTADGEKIISFLTSNKVQEAILPLPLGTQNNEQSKIADDTGIDTSDWSV